MLPETAVNAAGFATPEWRIQEQASQDLNGDGILDIVMVLHDTDKKNVVLIPSTDDCVGGFSPIDTNPRVLVVAFGNPDHKSYRRVLENSTLITRYVQSNLEDPFGVGDGALTVKRGTFAVKLYHFANAGGWDMSNDVFTFRFQHNRFELIGYDDDSVSRGSGETTTTSANLSTGQIKVSTGTISSDKVKSTWKSIKNPKTPSIEEIGDGSDYQLPE